MDGAIESQRDSRRGARRIIIWLALSLIINLVVTFPLAVLVNWQVAVFMGETVNTWSVAYAAGLIPTLGCTYSMYLKNKTGKAHNRVGAA
ncbi:MAG: hypothetical protein ACTSPR_02570 [Candidatus Thorarchaeota archaeon]